MKAEGERQAFLQAEARERAAEAEAKATQMVSDAIASNLIPKLLIILLHKKYTEALKEIGGADNSKVVLMPLEAGNLMGSIAGIAELLKGDKKTN